MFYDKSFSSTIPLSKLQRWLKGRQKRSRMAECHKSKSFNLRSTTKKFPLLYRSNPLLNVWRHTAEHRYLAFLIIQWHLRRHNKNWRPVIHIGFYFYFLRLYRCETYKRSKVSIPVVGITIQKFEYSGWLLTLLESQDIITVATKRKRCTNVFTTNNFIKI